jgi:hypothetical protein
MLLSQRSDALKSAQAELDRVKEVLAELNQRDEGDYTVGEYKEA